LDPPSAADFNGDPIPAGLAAVVARSGGDPAAVPEPTTLLLALLGLISIGLIRRHKRK
jgi:hypothetical protein